MDRGRLGFVSTTRDRDEKACPKRGTHGEWEALAGLILELILDLVADLEADLAG